jgi:hypothetical protein
LGVKYIIHECQEIKVKSLTYDVVFIVGEPGVAAVEGDPGLGVARDPGEEVQAGPQLQAGEGGGRQRHLSRVVGSLALCIYR